MKTKTTLSKILGSFAVLVYIASIGCSDGVLPEQGGGPDTNVGPLPFEVSFTADKEMVKSGESVQLAWEINGAESVQKIEITSDDVDNVFHSESAEAAGNAATPTLTKETVFTLTATVIPKVGELTPVEGGEGAAALSKKFSKEEVAAAEGDAAGVQPVVKMATVTVMVEGAGSAQIVKFEADAEAVEGASDAYMVSAGQSLVLQWAVEPSDAQVKIEASAGDQPVQVDCGEFGGAKAMSGEGDELNSVYASTGCVRVTMAEDAKPSDEASYTLSIVGSEDVQQTITLIVGGEVVEEEPQPEPEQPQQPVAPTATNACNELEIKLPETPVLVGEQVAVTVTAKDAETLKQLDGGSVEVKSATGEAVKATKNGDAYVALVKAEAGVVTVTATLAGGASCDASKGISVVLLEQEGTADSTVRFVGDEKAGAIYAGMNKGEAGAGKIEFTKFAPSFQPSVYSADAVALIKSKFKLASENTLKTVVKDFPVNSVAVTGSGTLMGVTTGLVFYKGEKDEAFKTFRIHPLFKQSSYQGSHPTCFGKTLTGITGDDVESYVQYCDLLVTDSGGVIFAHDHGIDVIDSVDDFIADDDVKKIKSDRSVVKGVVNDLERSDSKIYAATAKGVYLSTDGAVTWSSISDEKTTYTVKAVGDKLYAGTDDGVYVKGSDNSWTKAEQTSGKIYSIDADSSGAVLAGGENGLFINRTGGGFGSVELKTENKVVRAVKFFTRDGEYHVYIGTEAGALHGSAATGLSAIVGKSMTTNASSITQTLVQSTESRSVIERLSATVRGWME